MLPPPALSITQPPPLRPRPTTSREGHRLMETTPKLFRQHVASIGAAAALLAAAGPALAHHIPGHGIAWMGPASMAGQDVEMASFALAESGSYVATSTKLEYAVIPRFSLLA